MVRLKCMNPECGKIFLVPARISIEKRSVAFTPDIIRIIVEKPCCPFCEGIEFEEAA